MHFQLVLRIHPLPEELPQVTKSLASFAAHAEALPGCMGAGFYADVRHKDDFVFVEEWASRAALDAHLQSESFRMLRELAELAVEPPDLNIHRISQTTDAAVLEP